VKVYHIYKKITSLGRSDEVDMVLPDPGLADSHAYIHFDGRDFNIATTERTPSCSSTDASATSTV
jgi:pSer/pThr/pTyr-binding forkhead associated (FHA) protein